MRQIEIKARVKDEQDLRDALRGAGIELEKPVKHHDVVYSRPGAKDGDPAENWLRIRTENDTRHIFTLKRSVVGELDSIEHETVIENVDELRAIIKLLGYELFSDLTKTRQKAHDGEYEICFDTVEGLGTFIEIEKLCDEDVDGARIVDELWSYLGKFGIAKDDQETHGYDVLIRMQEKN